MTRIFKYPFEVADLVTFELPIGAEIVHVGLDPQGTPCLWARVVPTAPKETRCIEIRGTGETIPDVLRHRWTFVEGTFVWHVFTT